MIIRNDDVSVDTTGKYLDRLIKVSEIADKLEVPIIQAITPIGNIIGIDAKWDNNKLKNFGQDKLFNENYEAMEFLKKRNDPIGVHGLWHTHKPTKNEIYIAKCMIESWGFKPTYFVTPFNEGEYPATICGLTVSAKTDSLETYLKPERGTPKTDIVYLHSWRFNELFTYQALEDALWRFKNENK